MRSIFLVLLLLNAAFFGHQRFYASIDKSPVQSKAALNQAPVENNIQLLVERDGDGPRPVRAKLKVNTKSSDEMAASDIRAEQLCTMVGPFGQLLYAENLVERLDALGVRARITPIEIKAGEVFWVYLMPEMSEKEALRRLYELQKKNVESYIITKGELANGISFGRFADALTAELKMNEVKRLGYEAQMKSVPQTISETWVMLDQGSDEKINESLWAELLSQQEVIEKRQNVCLGVASE
jgi:hypothetical protein